MYSGMFSNTLTRFVANRVYQRASYKRWKNFDSNTSTTTTTTTTTTATKKASTSSRHGVGGERYKSSAAAYSISVDDEDDDDDGHDIFQRVNGATTASPHAFEPFDAWGAGSDIRTPISFNDELKLSKDAVRIPTDTTKPRSTSLPSDTEILGAYDHLMQRQSSVHFGYPYNLMYNHEELYPFMRYSINNLGDPFVPSNYGVHSRPFECAVIDFFAHLFKAKPEETWGYVTSCGTEGNLHGILLARECHPEGILYASRESHYSVFKAARYYRMDSKSIPTLPMGEIDYHILRTELDKNRDKPAIINANIGTTVKGAIDNLDRIFQLLQDLNIPRDRYHIHCDGALSAMMMPFLKSAPEISFRRNIDSISVSGHKMLGCPMPCGIALSRKEHVDRVEERIDYLNSVDTTIMGSRNGQSALYLWYTLRKKSIAGIKEDVLGCIQTARYLLRKLTSIGISCRLNNNSNTVVLERPMEDQFIKRWQLACEEDIAHVVVMPNVTRAKIDLFVQELEEGVQKFGRTQPWRDESPLTQLYSTTAWGPGGGMAA